MILKVAKSNEEGLVIATGGGGGKEGEKVNLMICLAGELNPVKGKSTDHYTKEDC